MPHIKTRTFHKLTALFLAVTLLLEGISQPIQQNPFAPVPVQGAQESSASGLESGTIGEETPEPQILGEITEKRTAGTKHFLLSDGSCCAVQYREPVHYRDETGTWQEYDNTVEPVGPAEATEAAGLVTAGREAEISQTAELSQNAADPAETGELKNKQSDKDIRLSQKAKTNH